MNDLTRNIVLWVVIAIVLLAVFSNFGQRPGAPEPLQYSQFLSEVRSGGSYLSHSDRRVHFGLGAASAVALLEVRWPSGAVDRFVDLPVDQVFVAREGSGDD